jgi:hypothetical protein
MAPHQVHRCLHCSAPLDVAPGVEVLACRFCGVTNDLRRPPAPAARPPHAVHAPHGPGATGAGSNKTALVVALVAGVLVVLGAVAAGGAYFVTARRSPSDSSDARPATARLAGRPFVLAWASERSIHVQDTPSMQIDAAVHEGNYQLTFRGFPERTRWTVGERQGVVTSSVFSIAKIESVEGALGSVPTGRIKDHALGPDDDLVVELPTGERATVRLKPVQAWSSIIGALRRVENGPVKLEPEAPRRPTKTSVGFVETLSLEVFGPAETLRDLDEIALPRRLTAVKGEKTCDGYKDAQGNPRPPVKVLFKETEVVVFDRRTGDQLASKVFSPEVRCPMFSFTKDGSQDSYPTSRPIHEWLKRRVRR